MPFDTLPNRLGSIPPIYQYQNLPAQQPFPLAQYLSAIGGPLTNALGVTIEQNSPEGRQKRELAQAELELQQQKLNYIRSYPEAQAALFGGKGYIDPLREEEIRSRIKANNALAGQRDRSGSGEDTGIDLNSYFGEEPPLPVANPNEVPALQNINGLPTDIPEEGGVPAIQPEPNTPQPNVGAIPSINVPDSAKLVDVNAPSPGVYSTDTLASEETAIPGVAAAQPESAEAANGKIHLSAVESYPPPPPGRRTGVDDQGRITYDNGVVADPKTHSIEWADGHGNTFRYAGGKGVMITEAPKPKEETPEAQMLKRLSAIEIGDARGAEVLDKVPQELRGDVQAISEYRYPKLSSFALRSPYYQRLLSIITAYDPNFDVKKYDQRQRLLNDFSAGKTKDNVNSINTVIGHLGSAANAFDDLGNINTKVIGPALNSVKNEFLDKAGFASPGKYSLAADTASIEIARALTGGVPNQSEIDHWKGKFGNAKTPDAFKGVIQEAIDLLSSRLTPFYDQYRNVMGKELNYSLLNDKPRAVVNKFGDEETKKALNTHLPTAPFLDAVPVNPDSTAPASRLTPEQAMEQAQGILDSTDPASTDPDVIKRRATAQKAIDIAHQLLGP